MLKYHVITLVPVKDTLQLVTNEFEYETQAMEFCVKEYKAGSKVAAFYGSRIQFTKNMTHMKMEGAIKRIDSDGDLEFYNVVEGEGAQSECQQN